MSDVTYPQGQPSLWKELADGSTGVGVRLAVTVVLAAVSTAAALLGGYFLAALNPGWDYAGGAYGVRPSDELMVTVSVVAGAGFLAAAGWLWSRGRANRAVIYATVLSFAIIGVTVGLGVVAESALQGGEELVIAGVIFLGLAALVLTWIIALRYRGPWGRPARNAQDGLLDVLCPGCGYRMVGLRESRCPECGADYTLDELLARQRFAPVPPAIPPPPPMPPPIPVAAREAY